MPHRCIEDDDRSCRTARKNLLLMGLLRIAHHLTGLAPLQMRSGHETRSAVLSIEGIDHQDAADQRPPIGSILDVHMKPLCQCARIERSCAHAAELEWSADDLTTCS